MPNAASSTAPTRATVTYTLLKPWSGIEITSATQSIAFRTTAEPIPWVASAKPASVPLTPFRVKSR